MTYPQRENPPPGFQTVDNLTVQKPQFLTVMKYENHSSGGLKFIPKLI